MYKRLILLVCLYSLIAAPALAEKPGWAGKGRPATEEKNAHRSTMETRENVRGDREGAGEYREKVNPGKDKQMTHGQRESSGLEKQQSKKAGQVQKELDKGSERGREARETRRKWWRFWGE